MLVLVTAVTSTLYASTAALPHFSETLPHLMRAGRYTSVWRAFDFQEVPFRPLPHAFYYAIARVGPIPPWVARIPAYALHAIAALLTIDFAKRLRCSQRATWVALIAFLLFPNVAGLVWVAALSGPGRVACVLAGLCVYLRHRERPSWRTGLGLVALQVVALGFHQSGIFLAPFCVLLLWARRELRLGIRDPWLLTSLAISGVYVVGTTFVLPKYPTSAPLAMLPNSVRMSLVLVPEVVRANAIDGLRGHLGSVGFALGALAVAATVAVYGAALRSASRLGRALFVMIVLDLSLPVMVGGFAVRYAYLSSALVGCALGLAFDAATGRRRGRGLYLAALVAVGVGWTYDTVVDVREHRRAGAIVNRVLDEATRVRAVAGDRVPIALVDLPLAYGRERDIPLFDWGAEPALSMRGAHGRWLFWRTTPAVGASEAIMLDPAEVSARIAAKSHPILVYDPVTERLIEAVTPTGAQAEPR